MRFIKRIVESNEDVQSATNGDYRSFNTTLLPPGNLAEADQTSACVHMATYFPTDLLSWATNVISRVESRV